MRALAHAPEAIVLPRNPIDRFQRVLRKRLRAWLSQPPVNVAPGQPAPAADATVEERLTRLEQLNHSIFMEAKEIKLMLAAHTLPPSALWKGKPDPVEGAPGVNAFPMSTLCRQDSFEEPHFSYWARRIGENVRYHRKLWEFVFILQSLWERGAIKPGARGLGFGVGQEALPAFFASQGVRVMATDMTAEQAARAGWIASNEHAAGKAALARPGICPTELFEANVDFSVCDMNAIPQTLRDFDFCWSACAFEHLGSIEAGLQFVENSLETLRPGGWAVHTSEYTMSSNDVTIATGDTVLFRRRDYEELYRRLTEKGHYVAPFDFTPGDGPIDRYLDILPYRPEPHVIMALWGHQTTSIGVIVQKGGGYRPPTRG